jgi:hypothetical protein
MSHRRQIKTAVVDSVAVAVAVAVVVNARATRQLKINTQRMMLLQRQNDKYHILSSSSFSFLSQRYSHPQISSSSYDDSELQNSHVDFLPINEDLVL